MTVEQLEERFTALTEKWMGVIGQEHHKDRDCHFYIERVWSYGDPPYWRARHSGYWSEWDCSADTYEDCLKRMIGILTVEIAIADAERCLGENND